VSHHSQRCMLLLLFSLATIAHGRQNGLNFLDDEWSPYPYNSPQAAQELAALRSQTNANWICLTFCWYQWNLTSTDIYAKPGVSANDSAITTIVNHAHSMGVKVMIRPLVDPDWSNPLNQGFWRGEIGINFTSTEWTAWFNSYNAYVWHFAQLAQTINADEFSVGGELVTASHQTTYWSTTIAGVRQRFTGPILYSANHGNEHLVKFWDLVDFIAVDAYYTLVPLNTAPTVAQLEQAWSPIVLGLRELSLRYNKSVIFAEVGYCSQPGANIFGCYSSVVNTTAQANCYQALLNVFYSLDWFEGIFWWAWTTDPADTGPNSNGYTPQNKPAASILKQFYTNDQQQLQISQMPRLEPV